SLVLTVISGPDKGKRFQFDEPALIGRSSEALRTTDSSISRRHAELTPDGSRWFVRDLGSSHGTFVNGVRITERSELKAGDHLLAGSTLFLCGMAEPDPGAERLIELLSASRIDVEVLASRRSEDELGFAEANGGKQSAFSQLKVLYRLTQLTTQVYDRRALLEKILDLAFDVFSPDRGFVLLLDAQKGEPLPVAVRHRTEPKAQRRVAVAKAVVQRVVQDHIGLLARTTPLRRDAAESNPPVPDGKRTRSVLCVPIHFHNHVFGVLYINTLAARRTYDESQLALLTAIGQHTGLALQNAEMYRVQVQNERLAAVGETVASLSHSIKNILQGLRGGADVLEMALKKEDLQLASGGWDVLSRNLGRVYRLTMNMLAFTKRTPLELELTKPRPLLLECAELLKDQCERKGVELIVDTDPDMPPIPVDPNAIHQAVMNLLTNALQAVDSRTGVITLRTEFEPARRASADGMSPATPAVARIIVSDNGQGIPADQLPHIFEAFYSTKGIRGTGLGLAVTRKIVEEHHGTVHVKSDPGKGAAFIIALPATAVEGIDPADTTQPGRRERHFITPE
ncbi:MAG: ATP-binding protein, partial [Phycisphaerales bacterium JB038]